MDPLLCCSECFPSGKHVRAEMFLAVLGRGHRAFLIGKISDSNPEFGKF